MNETWRDIPGWESRYQASTLGRIRSVIDGIPHVLAVTRHRDGYGKVKLSRPGVGMKTYHPHTLVALAFLGPRPLGNVIDHINQIHSDHRPENLRYVTVKEGNLNRKANYTSPSHTGTPCVFIHQCGGYVARTTTTHMKVRRRLGRFQTIEEARKAVDDFREIVRNARKVPRLKGAEQIRLADVLRSKSLVNDDSDFNLLADAANVLPQAEMLHQEIIRRETEKLRARRQGPSKAKTPRPRIKDHANHVAFPTPVGGMGLPTPIPRCSVRRGLPSLRQANVGRGMACVSMGTEGVTRQ